MARVLWKEGYSGRKKLDMAFETHSARCLVFNVKMITFTSQNISYLSIAPGLDYRNATNRGFEQTHLLALSALLALACGRCRRRELLAVLTGSADSGQVLGAELEHSRTRWAFGAAFRGALHRGDELLVLIRADLLKAQGGKTSNEIKTATRCRLQHGYTGEAFASSWPLSAP